MARNLSFFFIPGLYHKMIVFQAHYVIEFSQYLENEIAYGFPSEGLGVKTTLFEASLQ